MSATDNLDHLLAEYNAKLSNVMPQAVAFNVGLFTACSIIYEPKGRYYEGEKQPPKINNGFFSWVSPLLNTKEPELLEKIGLDSVAFLRFLRLMRWMTTAVAGLACAVLIPLDFMYNKNHVNSDDRNFLSMFTIQNVSNTSLFVHVAAEYVITFIVLGFVWWHWKEMLRLRLLWFRSTEYQNSFYARTVMILNVPKKIRDDEGLHNLFQGLKVPYPTTSVHIARKVQDLPDLIEYHNQTVREFEQILVTYLKGGKLGKKRPTITIGGFLGMGGETKDAIEFYTNKLRKTEDTVNQWRERIDKAKVENYGFASMGAVYHAHMVAKQLSNRNPKGTTITLAPNPKDIIWKNLTMSDAARASSRTVGWVWLTLVCFLNTIPLLFISLVANLAAVSQYVDFLDKWSHSSPSTFSLAAGILPPTISAFFGYFLPKVMRKLSKYQGAITRSRLDRAVVARYFAFLVISQLFIFSLIGVGFKTGARVAGLIQSKKNINVILKEFEKLPGNIQSTYLEQSSYWLTFFPLRGFLAVFDLAQLINLVWVWIKTRLFGRTPRDIMEWTQPPAFEFAIYYSNMLFMATVALVYAPLAPLVPLAAAVVFWMSSIVYKYQLMFVFVSKVESGGRMWNVVMNRLLVSTFFMHALVALTIGLQMGWRSYYWASTLPPALFVIIFKIFIRRYDQQFRYYVPTSAEEAESKVHSQRSDLKRGALEKKFGHPALHDELETPMVHKKMVPLLSQVYNGRLAQKQTSMAEYGGQKMEASIAPGGIKIAGIDQAQLEYDLAMYQRDRGEADSDGRSLSSSTMLDSRSMTPAPTHAKRPSGYDAYLNGGPIPRGNEMEMANLPRSGMRPPPEDATPLLPPTHGFSQQQQSYPPSNEYGAPAMHRFDSTPNQSTASLVSSSQHYAGSQEMVYPNSGDPYDRRYNQTPAQGYGRPYPPSRDQSTYSLHQQYPSGNAGRPGGR